MPWAVLTDEGIELDVVQRYLREVVARGGSPLSTRSYAFDLLRWWHWLTPCKHEHACIRCPMLRVDPKQRERIVEIIANLTERIKEAELNGWLGEVAGLKTSREAAIKKLTSLDRAAATAAQSPAGKAELGIPMPRHPLRH